MKRTLKNGKKPGRGMALLATMIILMLVLSVGLLGVATGGVAGMSGGTKNSQHQAKRKVNGSQAWSLAESGVQASLQWLQDQAAPPSDSTAFAPANFFDGTTADGYSTVAMNLGGSATGTFSVRMYPYTANATNVDTKQFVIESIGRYQGQEQIVRIVATQDTFAKYAYFADISPASTSWWSNTKFRGPVHINANVEAGQTPRTANILWRNTGTASDNQMFLHEGADALTVSADRINYSLNSIGNFVDPSTIPDFDNIAKSGKNSIRTNVSQVPLPSASTTQLTAALGSWSQTTANAAANGVHLPPSGGIFIKGDVNNMDFETSGNTGIHDKLYYGFNGNVNQIIKIYQTDTALNKEVRYTVTIDPRTNTTTITRRLANIGSTNFNQPAAEVAIASASGTTNKVIYSTGNIGKQGSTKTGGVSGMIANNLKGSGDSIAHNNNWTLATAADKDLNIDDNIRYEVDSFIEPNYNATRPKYDTPTKMTGTLGIVSRRVQVVDKIGNAIGNATGTNPGNSTSPNLYIHATVFAFDTFDVTNHTTRNYNNGNTISNTAKILGGYIVKKNGQFGQVNGSGNQVSGFARDLTYDPRVALNPPPFFPKTANRYITTSIQRVTSTLE
jgi:Tfp pilus assembly protein PilX